MVICLEASLGLITILQKPDLRLSKLNTILFKMQFLLQISQNVVIHFCIKYILI